jgi:hypothetical protein
MATYSQAYIECLSQGPFPGQVDPWAEAAHYFQALHAKIIGRLLAEIREPLLEKRYLVGCETSLQIAEGREPDLYVRDQTALPRQPLDWDYALVAEELLAEPGIAVIPSMPALHISDSKSGDLVTVVEIISPGNKERDYVVQEYREQRDRLVNGQKVNVVELDLTRSVKRLFEHHLTQEYAYHGAVFLPRQGARIIHMPFGQPLKRVALPLRAAGIAVEVHATYRHPYQVTTTAGHIRKEGRYTAEPPFPSLLTAEQRQAALGAVADWQHKLAELEAG